jgi:hypothetical protein
VSRSASLAPSRHAARAGILLWAVGLAGIALIVQGSRGFLLYLRSQDWPSVPGEIVQATPILERTTEIKDGAAVTTRRTIGVSVTYSYELSGIALAGQRIGLREAPEGDEAYSTRIIADYPVGRPVAVYYDPGNPEYSVLERTAGKDGVQMLLGVALILASGYTILSRRPSRGPKAEG